MSDVSNEQTKTFEMIAGQIEELHTTCKQLLHRGTANPFPDTGNYYAQSPLLNKYFLVDLLIPALDRTLLASRYAQGYLDGIIATIYAIQTYQLTGFWPTSLEDAGVIDEWSGEPLLIVNGDAHPAIYSVGSNHKDDAGAHNIDAKVWKKDEIYDGDWVMWPPSE